MLFYTCMCVRRAVCLFLFPLCMKSPWDHRMYVWNDQSQRKCCLSIHLKKNPWKSWHYRFSDEISTIFSGVPVKLGFYETAPTQCDSSAPAVPVLCSCCHCARPVWAAEGTVDCRRLLNHSAHSAKGLIDRLSELHLQMVTKGERGANCNCCCLVMTLVGAEASPQSHLKPDSHDLTWL